MSVRYLKNVGICACEDRNIWTRAATGDAEWWTLAKNLACFFYFLRKRVAGWRSETDVSVVGCLIKVIYDAREWTHHDHTASELPDNIRNVSGI